MSLASNRGFIYCIRMVAAARQRKIAIVLVCALAIGVTVTVWPGSGGDAKKQYWATSLSRTVEADLLQGLQAALARGETGWLDVDA